MMMLVKLNGEDVVLFICMYVRCYEEENKFRLVENRVLKRMGKIK
jgi:hypothetical protein